MKSSQRTFFMILVLALLFSGVAPVTSLAATVPSPPRISVLVNGTQLALDVPPIIVEGRTLVPLRAIFESLGARVTWNPDDRSVIATRDKTTVWLQIGSATARITSEIPLWSPDGLSSVGTKQVEELTTLDVPAQILDGRTLVPVRFVSEALGSRVSWDAVNRTVGVVATTAPLKAWDDLSGEYSQWTRLNRRPESRYLARDLRSGTLLALVDSELYPHIKASLATWTNDLADEFYAVDVYTYTGHMDYSEELMKEIIRKWYLNLVEACNLDYLSPNALDVGSGVVLIGDGPDAYVHMRTGITDTGDPYDGVFLCDLYLTDLNGKWDTKDDKNTIFISQADPEVIATDSECLPEDMCPPEYPTNGVNTGHGAARPEIWLGRISAKYVDNGWMIQQQAQFINSYFTRNHLYRQRMYPIVGPTDDPASKAARNRVLFTDDDWSLMAPFWAQNLSWGFPAGQIIWNMESTTPPYTWVLNKKGLTTRANYLGAIEQPNLWLEMLAHSDSNNHYFAEGGSANAADLRTPPAKSLFYWIQGCGACDFRQIGNLGTAYLFSENGLAVVGNTSFGAHETGTFYSYLGKGYNLGQAYMISQRLHWRNGFVSNVPYAAGESSQPKRFYNQVFLGDPTLRPDVFVPSRIPTPPLQVNKSPLPLSASVVANKAALQSGVRARAIAEVPTTLRKVTTSLRKSVPWTNVIAGKPIIDPMDPFKDPVAPVALPTYSPTYSITLNPAAQSVTAGTTVVFTGRLISISGGTLSPGAGKTAKLYSIAAASPTAARAPSRVLVASAVTSSDGTFIIRFAPASTSTFIAVYANADGSDAAVSDNSVITVTNPTR